MADISGNQDEPVANGDRRDTEIQIIAAPAALIEPRLDLAEIPGAIFVERQDGPELHLGIRFSNLTSITRP